MKKAHKVFGTILLGAVMITSSVVVHAEPPQSTSAAASSDTENGVLQGEVGSVIYDGNYIYKRLPDNSKMPMEFKSRASTEGFVVSDFGGNTSLDKTILLSDTYLWWKIWVQNTADSELTVSVENDSTRKIPAGETWNIWSINAWKAGKYKVGFTDGAGMHGQAACRVGESKGDLGLN